MSEQHPWQAVVIREKSMHCMADALRIIASGLGVGMTRND
jgi:hypothetical protein